MELLLVRNFREEIFGEKYSESSRLEKDERDEAREKKEKQRERDKAINSAGTEAAGK